MQPLRTVKGLRRDTAKMIARVYVTRDESKSSDVLYEKLCRCETKTGSVDDSEGEMVNWRLI